MRYFGMTMEEEKIQLVEFGRFAEKGAGRKVTSQKRSLSWGLHITVRTTGTVNFE